MITAYAGHAGQILFEGRIPRATLDAVPPGWRQVLVHLARPARPREEAVGNAWACGAVVGEGGGTRKYSQVSASLRCRESFPAVATAEIAIRASNATAALSNGTAATIPRANYETMEANLRDNIHLQQLD